MFLAGALNNVNYRNMLHLALLLLIHVFKLRVAILLQHTWIRAPNFPAPSDVLAILVTANFYG